MIYHLISEAAWNKQIHERVLKVPSLEVEGFIHCCTQQQIEGVLSRYFKGQTDLLVLAIDEHKLEAELRLEKSTNDELFPHVYGAINKGAILSVNRVGKQN
ncbi:MAG: hypothetical protein UZ12_BCD005001495 [Bacteroidetes bacterium OLB12]|nr:MAG: hypothetical protein UZ12_BCD005001495 [Bacteroidetes bacterium OLB12]HNR74191.1 DUF952 domain-containing protein [Cyclobacteriaceae bacterium]HNU43434.1 DUF952 domain-containing protein [Cyclobacteriaceae bacterium]